MEGKSEQTIEPCNSNKLTIITLAAVFNTVFLWSSSLVAIRIGLHAYTPGALALLRYAIASMIMVVVYLFIPNKTPIKRQHIPLLALMGMCGIGLYNIALNYGEVSVPAGIASFIIGLIPVFAITFAGIFLKECISKKMVLGIGISLVGTMIIALSEIHNIEFEWGLLDCLIAALMGAIFTTLQKSLINEYKPLELTCFTMWFGTLLLSIFTPQLLPTLRQLPQHETMAAVYLGIFPGVLAYATWAYALSKMPASRAVSFMYLLPLLCIIMGYFVLDEIPGTMALLGGCVALAGTLITNKNKVKNK